MCWVLIAQHNRVYEHQKHTKATGKPPEGHEKESSQGHCENSAIDAKPGKP